MTQQEAEILPLRPADYKAGLKPNAEYAPARTRAREDEPRPERRSMTLRMPSMPSITILSGLLQGGSLLATAPGAVLTVWEDHRLAAGYFKHWWSRYPRLIYGAAHAFAEVPFLYLWAWSGHSPVLRIFVLATLLAILRLGFGVHIVWSWL